MNSVLRAETTILLFISVKLIAVWLKTSQYNEYSGTNFTIVHFYLFKLNRQLISHVDSMVQDKKIDNK